MVNHITRNISILILLLNLHKKYQSSYRVHPHESGNLPATGLSSASLVSFISA